jgi:hypothetical protein
MLRNWLELLSFNQLSKSFHPFSECIEFVIRFAAFKGLKARSVLLIFFVCLFSRSGLGVALRNLAFLEIDVHNNWRPFRPQISFVIDQVSDQSSLEV